MQLHNSKPTSSVLIVRLCPIVSDWSSSSRVTSAVAALLQFCCILDRKAVPRTAKLRRMTFSREVVVYSRKGCHLCEIVKETLAKLERRGGFQWREIDVDTDDELRRQFTDEVPVVFIDGRKAFKYRMDEREFLRKLAS
jgi:glutaredoxin